MTTDNHGYEIIDAHIHPVSAINGSDFTPFGLTTAPSEMINILRRAGISRAAGSIIRPFAPGEEVTWEKIHNFNLAALEFRKLAGDFYIPGIAVHPAFPTESISEIETMYHEHGVRMIGELVGYMMNYGCDNYTSPLMDDIWRLACDLGIVISIHITSIEQSATVLRRFPELKLIIAHPTASQADYRERMHLVAKYPNAALDISGSGPNTWGMLREGIRIAGKEKLIFGTDFPLRNPGMYVAGVLFENLRDDENAAIFAGNFKRLLNCD